MGDLKRNLLQNWPLIVVGLIMWFGSWERAITAASVIYVVTTLWIHPKSPTQGGHR